MREGADQQLLERARSGDRRALEELLDRHQARVYRFGMKMCRDREDARDVLQETLLAAARTVQDFRGASSISTWLYAIARSFCLKKRRKSKYAPDEEQSVDADESPAIARMADPARGPDEALAGKQIERALDRAIATLEPMYREVLVLRDVEGLTAPEVAEVLGISTQAVKSRLHRARLSVRKNVAPLLGIPSEEPPSGSCPDVLELLSRHLENDLSAQVCSEMERHLSACPACRGKCESLKRTLALCRNAGASEAVPPSVQAAVKAAVRGFLSHQT